MRERVLQMGTNIIMNSEESITTEPEVIMIDLASAKQKCFGAFLIVFGFSSVFLCNGDATAAVVLIPSGLGMLLSKRDLFTSVRKEGES